MSTTMEWRTANKTTWGPGEWQDEPDKVQWVDEATGLDCLIVRGPHGALCGYVGLPETHALFGKDYDSVDVEVHGGLTFADRCHEPTREAWEKWRARLPETEREAARYPRGDASERLAEWGQYGDDHEGWRTRAEASFICHRPLDGRPDKVWWLGFDCAHSGDLSPKYDRRSAFREGYETYKSLSYVKQECAQLAAQLAAVRERP